MTVYEIAEVIVECMESKPDRKGEPGECSKGSTTGLWWWCEAGRLGREYPHGPTHPPEDGWRLTADPVSAEFIALVRHWIYEERQHTVGTAISVTTGMASATIKRRNHHPNKPPLGYASVCISSVGGNLKEAEAIAMLMATLKMLKGT